MSGLFGSTQKTPNPNQKPFGFDATRASTAEAVRPVPYLAGKNRFAMTFITNAFDDVAVPVTQTVGKQKTKSGNNFYTSFGGLYAHGPMHGLHDIILNGDSVYTESTTVRIITLTFAVGMATAQTKNAHGLTTGQSVIIAGPDQPEYWGTVVVTVTDDTHFTFAVAGSPVTPATGKITMRLLLDPVFRDIDHPDYVDILIPDYGEYRHYWGTETQLPDDYIQGCGIPQPAFKGICWGRFKRLFLGFNQKNVQNIEVVMSRIPEYELDPIEMDANPAAVFLDALQNSRAGFGLTDERVNITKSIESGETLAAEGIGLSPTITRQQDARQVLLTLLEYFNGYPEIDADGKIGLALARAGAPIVTIADSDLIGRPKFAAEDWSLALTPTHVKFTNRDLNFKEDAPQPYRDVALFSINREVSPLMLDRPWITRMSVAQAVCDSSGRLASLPKLPGSVRLRMTGTLYDDLAPGALFDFNHSARDLSNLVFRVTSRNFPRMDRPEFEINFELDRSYVFKGVA